MADENTPQATQYPPPRQLNVGGIQVHCFGLDALESRIKRKQQLRRSSATQQATQVEEEQWVVGVNSVCFNVLKQPETSQSYFDFCHYLTTQPTTSSSERSNLLVFAFDQRNHGTRLLDEKANFSWREGNETHAMDMYSIQLGTARDVSFLIDTLPMFLEFRPRKWGCIGVSLGGHATLLAVANEVRLSAAVSIIGCGDYIALMGDRVAKTSKRKDPTAQNQRSRPRILWSDLPADSRKQEPYEDYEGLVDDGEVEGQQGNGDGQPGPIVSTNRYLHTLVSLYDPISRAKLAASTARDTTVGASKPHKDVSELSALLLKDGGLTKRDEKDWVFTPLLILNGGSDKLVPANCNQEFIAAVKEAQKARLGRDLSESENEASFKVVVESEAKHEVTRSMKEMSRDWFWKWLRDGDADYKPTGVEGETRGHRL
ncbi:hypothetical protein HK102_013390 [Quaeritorhiza haematococci]|nr:hypothetical protein HK102_013390 [Quaeritorhiza haematococci]